MAEDNNKILIEIVLDDGSIQKGFAKIPQAAKKAAEDSNKEFKTLGEVLNSDIFDDLKKEILGIPVKFAAIGIAAVAAGVLIKEAFDLTLEGEKIKAVETQFENLAEQAGITANELKEGLEKSANGLISTDELLKIANGSIIELGSSASRLPEVLEISRKSVAALGGTLQEKFTTAIQAIETGNTRLLRSQGIILDQEKAFKEYAKTLGLTAGELTKAQQQQALLNAFIDQAGAKFAGVKGGLIENNIAVKQITVSMHELREQFALFVNSSIGPAFASITRATVDLFKELNKSPLQKEVTSAADLKAKIFELQGELENYKEKAKDTSLLNTVIWGDYFNQQVTKTTEKIAALTEEFNKIANSRPPTAADNTEEEVAKEVRKQEKLTQAQINAIEGRQSQINALEIAAAQGSLNNDELVINQIQNQEQRRLEIAELARNQEIIAELEFAEKKKQIAIQYSSEQGFTEEQRRAATLAGEADLSNKLKAIKEKERTALKSSKTAEVDDVRFALNQIATLQDSSSRELAAIGKAAAITQATIDGYLAVQKVYATIPYPFNIPAAALVGAAAAANVAKIASTGGGGGGGASFDSGLGSSPISSQPTPVDITPNDQLERSPTSNLVVNISGDILGDEASGNRIVQLINSAFDTSGVNLRQGIV